jgi:hypothetical protein
MLKEGKAEPYDNADKIMAAHMSKRVQKGDEAL